MLYAWMKCLFMHISNTQGLDFERIKKTLPLHSEVQKGLKTSQHLHFWIWVGKGRDYPPFRMVSDPKTTNADYAVPTMFLLPFIALDPYPCN